MSEPGATEPAVTGFWRDGAYCVALFPSGEAQMLRQCAALLAEMLSGGLDRDDPAVARLFPDAYRASAHDATEFRELTEGELTRAKLRGAAELLSRVPAGGGEVRLDEPGAEVWLRSLNDLRLILGARLDVRADTDLLAEMDDAVMRNPTSPRVVQLLWYLYLGELQASLLSALTGRPV